MDTSQVFLFPEMLEGFFSITVDRLSDVLHLNRGWFQWLWIGLFCCGFCHFHEQHVGASDVHYSRFVFFRDNALGVLAGPGMLIVLFALLPPWFVFKLSVEIYDGLRDSIEK